MTLDPSWLRDPARVFPVTVDPSVINKQGLSTYVYSADSVDHSMENAIKVGSYDSGPHSARSFLQFPGLGIDNSQVSVSAAELDVFVTHANGCPTAQRFDVAAVTQSWTPSTTRVYPGPSLGASIGSVAAATPNACANTSGDPSQGDWLAVPLNTATFNSWATGASADYGLGIYAATTDSTHWKYLGSIMNVYGAPSLKLTYTGAMLPQVLTQYPPNGTAVTTLTPQLSAEGSIDPNLIGPMKLEYQVFDAAGVRLVDSGLVSSAWSVPAGKLQWGQTYLWEVQASDGVNFSPNPTWYQLTTQVPQPAITSGLSQNTGGRGFDPAIGNYTTSVTDADVASIGPALSVVRDYNSRDPRITGAFGAAWSSVFDSRAVEKYDPSGTVVSVEITYPDGSQVGYGRNADGTFTAPSGRAAKLIRLANGYELIDKAVTTYTFTQSLGSGGYGISSISDADGRATTFTWASGHISTMTSAVSGRALHLTWSTPIGAANAHVATVVTDPAIVGQSSTALTWT